MEVMGLMLGEFVDEYTVRVVDVFAMPQSGTGVSVEAVDHVFQTNMLDMLKQTGRYLPLIQNLLVDWFIFDLIDLVLLHICLFISIMNGAGLYIPLKLLHIADSFEKVLENIVEDIRQLCWKARVCVTLH